MRVFDSSALLALIFDEAGAGKVAALLANGDDNVVGAANLSEVLAKLVDQGMSDGEVETVRESLALRVEALSAELAASAGRLRRQTRPLGLSLGDRCCLALAQAHGATVVTADRPWKQLKGFVFEFVR